MQYDTDLIGFEFFIIDCRQTLLLFRMFSYSEVIRFYRLYKSVTFEIELLINKRN